MWGVLAVGIFADGSYGDGWNGVAGGVKGILYGDAGQLGAQVVDMVTCFAWAFGVGLLVFSIFKLFIKVRVSPEAELEGLDVPEFGVHCYPDFVTQDQGLPHDVTVPASVGTSPEVRS